MKHGHETQTGFENLNAGQKHRLKHQPTDKKSTWAM